MVFNQGTRAAIYASDGTDEVFFEGVFAATYDEDADEGSAIKFVDDELGEITIYAEYVEGIETL